MKPVRIYPLCGGVDEYVLGVRHTLDANDFGFQMAGKVRYTLPPIVVVIFISFGECVGHAQGVGEEVVRYALQYTIRDVLSESAHDAPESMCIDCGPNKLGPLCSEDIEHNASQLCQNIPRVGANDLQVFAGEG